MTMYVTEIIDNFKQKQVKKIQRYKRVARTDKDVINKMCNSLIQMHSFYLEMDNYFTLPKSIATLQEMNIRNIGTSRFKKKWPSKDLRKVQQKNVAFNNFFYSLDEYRTLTVQWIDNDHVFCVATIHIGLIK